MWEKVTHLLIGGFQILLWISFIQLTHYKIRFLAMYFSSRTLYRTKSKNNSKLAIYENIKAKQNKISKAQRIRISVIFENCYNLFQQSFSFKKKPKYLFDKLSKRMSELSGKMSKEGKFRIYTCISEPFWSISRLHCRNVKSWILDKNRQ